MKKARNMSVFRCVLSGIVALALVCMLPTSVFAQTVNVDKDAVKTETSCSVSLTAEQSKALKSYYKKDVSSTTFAENKNLSAEQVAKRFDAINKKYKEGQSFSASDANFVLLYGSRAGENGIQQQISLSTGNSLNWKGTFLKFGTSYGTMISFSGTIWNYTKKGLDNNYGGDIKAVKVSGKTPKKMTVVVSCTTYGIFGKNGIGILYDGKISNSMNNASTVKMNSSKTFYGAALSQYQRTYCNVTTSEGYTFTVNGY